MPKLSPISERVANAVTRACKCALPDAPDLERQTAAAVAAIAFGRQARTGRSSHYNLDSWMDWWEAGDQRHLPSSAASVRAYLDHLERVHRAPRTIKRAVSIIKIFLNTLGWPDPGAAAPLRAMSKRCIAAEQAGLRTKPPTTPVGWAEIQECLSVVDASDKLEVNAVAAMLVLYDTMSREDAIFGHREGRIWHATPPPLSDLRRLPDGTGRLRIRTPARAEAYQDAALTPLTMSWLDMAIQGRHQDASAPLFVNQRGQGWTTATWRNTATKILKRAKVAEREISGRALRVGKALDLARAGTPLSDIQRAGYWSTLRRVRQLMKTYAPSDATQPHTRDLFASVTSCGRAIPFLAAGGGVSQVGEDQPTNRDLIEAR
jgi:hypothetical protein